MTTLYLSAPGAECLHMVPELDGDHILGSRIQLRMFYLYCGRFVHVLVRVVTVYWTPHETVSHLISGPLVMGAYQ